MTGPGPGRVRVALAGGGYDAHVGRGLLERLGTLCAAVGDFRKVHLFQDAGVPEALLASAARSFVGVAVTHSTYALNESTKSLRTLERMMLDLAHAGLERGDLVVVIGGGILGDVAGLAAGLHRRGVGVVPCPTTLLAMVDASVGGKTGVNLAVGGEGPPAFLKNAVGMFHQPMLVVADVDALASLPAREFRGGLAECIKHAVIAAGGGEDGPDLDTLAGMLPMTPKTDAGTLASLVVQNVGLKARVVAGDERELARGLAPGRRALNLGHTFAHAIEGCAGALVEVEGQPARPNHGEAVGLGLIAAASLGESLGLKPAGQAEALARVVARAGLPTRLAGAPAVGVLLSAMRQDKKSSGGVLRLVVPTGGGVSMLDDPGDGVLSAAWERILG